MRKSIAFPIIGVMAAALIAVIVVFILNINAANAEIDTHKNTIAGLETDLGTSRAEATDLSSKLTASESEVATLEGNVADLEGDVADLEARNTQLDSDLQAANSQITSLEVSNSWLTDELKMIKYPKNFTSVYELTDWLQNDNTDTLYSYSNSIQLSYILQVKALQSGFLLPSYVLFDSIPVRVYYGLNCAMIGDSMYLVDPANDDVEKITGGFPSMPTYPIPAP